MSLNADVPVLCEHLQTVGQRPSSEFCQPSINNDNETKIFTK